MAVYTDVPDDSLKNFLDLYDLGQVTSFKGIAEGVENSNFLLRTTKGGFILTLYEKRVAPADLPFFLSLMQHAAQKGVPCPLPVSARNGQSLQRLEGRPAVIVTFLDGISLREPNAQHCASVGSALASFHQAMADFNMQRPNSLSVEGWRPLVASTRDRADMVVPGLAVMIETAFDDLSRSWPTDLPRGVIHADLFPDNVLFLDGKLSGLIDFYFSCTDFWAYDLAVLINSWCFDSSHQFQPDHARAMIDAYNAHRLMSEQEIKALPILLRGAALRFLLTRLYDWLNQIPGALVKPKDPLEYLTKLQFFTQQAATDFWTAK